MNLPTVAESVSKFEERKAEFIENQKRIDDKLEAFLQEFFAEHADLMQRLAKR